MKENFLHSFTLQQEHWGQTFDALDLKGKTISQNYFDHCVFTSCHLNEARLLQCRFVDCKFVYCDLSNAKLDESTFRSVSFDNSKLLGIFWPSAASLVSFRAAGCVLNFSIFVGVNLRKCRLENCTIREADFAQADLSEGVFCASDFAGSRFLNSNLSKADFRRAINYAIGPRDNDLKKARFSLPEAMSLLYGLDIVLDDD